MFWQFRVPGSQLILDLHGTLNGIHYTGKLS
jgi:hypothetical protein